MVEDINRLILDTLDSYIEKYGALVGYLGSNGDALGPPPSDPAPPDLGADAISLQVELCPFHARPMILTVLLFVMSQTPVFQDNPASGMSFGGILTDVLDAPYEAGDSVFVQFVGYVKQISKCLVRRSLLCSCRANPRVRASRISLKYVYCSLGILQNNLRLEGTFLTVDRLEKDTWVTVRTDSHPSTTYTWMQTNTVSTSSGSALSVREPYEHDNVLTAYL